MREGGRLAHLLTHRESRHAVKYGIVGVTNVTIDFLLYALLLSLGVWYVLAKTVSLIIVTLNGYTFNRLWTFRTGDHRHSTLARYVAVQATGLAMNVALLTFFIELVGLDPLVAQAFAVPFVAAYSFLSNRLWTFARDIPSAR